MLFGAATIFVAVLFVRALTFDEIRSGLATYGLATGAATVGLWRHRRWGRSVALLVVLGNVGLGALALLAVILSRRGSVIGPAVLLATSLAVSYLLSRPIFDVPAEHD